VTLSNALDTLLSRLPGHFETSQDSNNYKLLSLVAKQSEDNQALHDTIIRFWDVDQSEGVGLDRLGKDEGISRGSYDDETYRKLIKIQYIINLSEGDRESINAILRAYLGEEFLFVEEGWNSTFNEPASILVNVKRLKEDFPYNLLKRIKATGVRAGVSVKRNINMNFSMGGVISTRNKIEIRPASFEMPTLTESKYYGGFISTRTKITIKAEVNQ
jgi:hypothetical protein